MSRETHDIEVVATYAFDQGAPTCLEKAQHEEHLLHKNNQEPLATFLQHSS